MTFFKLDNIPIITQYVPNKGLNEAAMALGGVVLAFNIITRLAMSFSKCIESSTKSSRSSSYINVYKARTAAKESPFIPLLYTL